MIKFLNYGKNIGIFLIFELAITFICSFLNLMGINSGITQIILLISNICIFLVMNIFNSINKEKKGYLQGIILSSIFILLMVLIKYIFISSTFRISTFIYYVILLISGIFGGMIGINKKPKTNQ